MSGKTDIDRISKEIEEAGKWYQSELNALTSKYFERISKLRAQLASLEVGGDGNKSAADEEARVARAKAEEEKRLQKEKAEAERRAAKAKADEEQRLAKAKAEEERRAAEAERKRVEEEKRKQRDEELKKKKAQEEAARKAAQEKDQCDDCEELNVRGYQFCESCGAARTKPMLPEVSTEEPVEDSQQQQDQGVGGDGAPLDDRSALQQQAWDRLCRVAALEETTATEASNKEFNKTPKTAIDGAASNDPSFSLLDLSGNTVFNMKHKDYCEQLAEALKSNTHITVVKLSKCSLDANDAKVLASALAVNDTVEVLHLDNNKISNDGAAALADALKSNSRLVELNLLGQPHQFGDACLANFVNMFDYNVTLTKIIWRLDSRKSFALNKLLVRNNTIKKWLSEGKDVSAQIPFNCNIPELKALCGPAPPPDQKVVKATERPKIVPNNNARASQRQSSRAPEPVQEAVAEEEAVVVDVAAVEEVPTETPVEEETPQVVAEEEPAAAAAAAVPEAVAEPAATEPEPEVQPEVPVEEEPAPAAEPEPEPEPEAEVADAPVEDVPADAAPVESESAAAPQEGEAPVDDGWWVIRPTTNGTVTDEGRTLEHNGGTAGAKACISLSTIGFDQGVLEFQVYCNGKPNVLVGVTFNENIDLTDAAKNKERFVCSFFNGKVFGTTPGSKEYLDATTPIGEMFVRVDLDERKIYFSRDGIDFGEPAFEDIPQGIYWPYFSLGAECGVTVI